MRDIVFVLFTAGFFALAVVFVGACERLVGAKLQPDDEQRT